MLAIPRPILKSLGLDVNAPVSLHVNDGVLEVRPATRKRRYTVEELMAKCDLNAPFTDEEKAWSEMPPVGTEYW